MHQEVASKSQITKQSIITDWLIFGLFIGWNHLGSITMHGSIYCSSIYQQKHNYDMDTIIYRMVFHITADANLIHHQRIFPRHKHQLMSNLRRQVGMN